MDTFLGVLRQILIVAGWFGVFTWLGYSAMLLKQISAGLARESLQAWPKVMKFMYLSGIGLCVLVCLPFCHLPQFTAAMIIIIAACMIIGLLYLRHSLRRLKCNYSRQALRHCIFALYVSSGYAAGIIIMLVFNPIFGGAKFFI